MSDRKTRAYDARLRIANAERPLRAANREEQPFPFLLTLAIVILLGAAALLAVKKTATVIDGNERIGGPRR